VVPAAMAKAAVHAMTMSLAVEWGPKGIRVNAVAPGPFPTENAWDKLNPLAETGVGATQADEVPLRRFGKMDELRNLMIFLMSDGCSYITGDTISIDGGHHLAAPARSRAFKTFAGRLATAREAIQASTRKEKKAGRPEINKPESPGRDAMDLAIATTSFECTIDGGSRISFSTSPNAGIRSTGVLPRVQLCMAELSDATMCDRC